MMVSSAQFRFLYIVHVAVCKHCRPFDAIELFVMSKMKKAQIHTLVVLRLNLSNCKKVQLVFQ